MRTTMTTTTIGAALVLLACGAGAEGARGQATRIDGATEGAALAVLAIDEDEGVARAATDELRARGPGGLEVLLATHAEAVARLRDRGQSDAELERLRAAIDAVAAQRDAHASGLYWHTDLAAAQEEARERAVPILSLRLLGRLDDELSCANSRYFRVLLYSDPRVSDELRERFVLHWSSERPVPRVTIDMGDGRVRERTLTGNSAHYVLDEDGRPLDVIVGLYSPGGFLEALAAARRVAQACGAGESECLARLHREHDGALQQRWAQAMPQVPFERALASLPSAPARPVPTAREAMPLTIGKMFRETPLLDALAPAGALGALGPRTPEPDWSRAALSMGALQAMHPRTVALLRLKGARAEVEEAAEALRRRAAADGVRNELLFRHRVHGWFESERSEVRAFESLNRAVYRDLMRTPADDPWLGLGADDLEDAIEVD